MKKWTLITALLLLALGGLLLHYRIHPFILPDRNNPGAFIFDPTKFLGTLLPLVDIFLVTLLFMSRRTALYGYLLNGMIVIYGTVLMGHYSIAEMAAKSIPWDAMIIKSTLPDILIAWADFFVGKTLYDYYIKGGA